MKKLPFLIILSLTGIIGYGQITMEKSTLGPAGDFFANENLSLDWTMSEIAVESFVQEGSLSLFLGFYLPEIITPTNEPDQKFQLDLYPNPCSGILNISASEGTEIMAEVFDQNGKIVLAKQMYLDGISDEINISFLPTGSYYLRIIDTSKKVWSSFKIQKI